MIVPKPGDRIRLIRMPYDPYPIPPGAEGTVTRVNRHTTGDREWFQVVVEWDNGRQLMLVVPPDEVEVMGEKGG